MQFSATAGVGPFDISLLSMTSVQVQVAAAVSIISTLLARPNTRFAIHFSFEQVAKQGQCFLCYVQRDLSGSESLNDKVKLNSDVGSRWVLDLWPMDLVQTFIVRLVWLCPPISKGLNRLSRSRRRDHRDPDGTLITMGVQDEGGST